MTSGFLYHQNFPADGRPDCLLKLQAGLVTPVPCNFGVASLEINNSSKNFNARFNISPGLEAPHFLLELVLAPAPNDRPTAEQLRKGRISRMYAIFMGYDEQEPNKYANREAFNYTSQKETNPPKGPLSFSPQLLEVQYSQANQRSTALPPKLRYEGVDPSKQHCISWKANRCVLLNRDLPTADLHQESRAAAKTFINMIDALTNGDGQRIMVVFKSPQISGCFWPRFASIPAPVPESQFLWVSALNLEEPLEVMTFPPNGTCERDSAMVNLLLAQRNPRWYDPKDKKNYVDVFASPLATSGTVKIAKLPTVIQFLDGRQYMATVLGCQSYEAQYSKVTTSTWFNGDHTCDVFPDQNNSRKFVILLNLRPPSNVEIEETVGSGDLPDVGDRVRISYRIAGSDYHTLNGCVERMPQAFLKYGQNICIVAHEPATMPQRGHISKQHLRFTARFHFRYFGSSHTPTQERIMSLMTNTSKIKPPVKADWVKQLLLAQNSHIDVTCPPASKSSKADVDRVCKSRNLNADQKAVLVHYATHRITVTRGPPGTGKSRLIDAILELEEMWENRTWVCTGSNTACDVLVKKTTVRKKNLQPEGLLRVKSAAEERLKWAGSVSERHIEALNDQPVTRVAETPEEAIARFLAEKENVPRAMSLEAMIKRRLNLRQQMLQQQVKMLYAKEYTELEDLNKAAHSFSSLLFEGPTPEEYDEAQIELERRYDNALRQVQCNYISGARGVFSTAAAANGALLRNLRPHAFILCEVSQLMEAEAVSALLHAMEGSEFSRVLLIGDDEHSGPTLSAPRNPFSHTGKISLFERLILSGIKTFTLRK